MAIILNGKKIADKILKGVGQETEEAKMRPKLVVVWAGNDPVSQKFIERKKIICEKLKIDFEVKEFSRSAATEEIVQWIKNKTTKEKCGIIVQLPLPKGLDSQKILNAIPPEYDIDCLGAVNRRKMTNSHPLFLPPTVAGILKLLEFYKVSLKGKRILIIGKGFLVGEPLSKILNAKGYNVKALDITTKDIGGETEKADILITATGSPKLIQGPMVKEGAVVVDAGCAFRSGKILGDVDYNKVKKKAKMITPVPGGVGPLTIAMLISNLTRVFRD